MNKQKNNGYNTITYSYSSLAQPDSKTYIYKEAAQTPQGDKYDLKIVMNGNNNIVDPSISPKYSGKSGSDDKSARIYILKNGTPVNCEVVTGIRDLECWDGGSSETFSIEQSCVITELSKGTGVKAATTSTINGITCTSYKGNAENDNGVNDVNKKCAVYLHIRVPSSGTFIHLSAGTVGLCLPPDTTDSYYNFLNANPQWIDV